jgi:DNA gyrase subunit B
VEKSRFDKMLSSQEIRLMISALGAGIGKEETDLAKLRYHKVILMTDADVDGSHIRTLLLTFFYRQIPGIIENGHLYIAQPPLYRVKKGKNEQYLRDEAALEDFLIGLSIENLKVGNLFGEELKAWVKTFLHCEKLLDVIQRKGRDRRVVSALLKQKEMTLDLLKDSTALEEVLKETEASLNSESPETPPFSFSLDEDSEIDGYRIMVTAGANGAGVSAVLDSDFLLSPEAQEITKLLNDLHAAGDLPLILTDEKGEASKFKSPKAVVDAILARSRQGVEIQRYKGLGEMNPGQLWETTMNPEDRTLLQVRIEDAYEADEIFSTLMGDEVEPRRRFIAENALAVKNLDI